MILREVSQKDIGYVKTLYREAFPLIERIPFIRLEKLRKNGEIKMFCAYENGEPCAMAFTACSSKSVLLMYFAVDSTKRNLGLGTKVIDALCDIFPRRRLLLEIETPDENKPNTVRRKAFYERCGLRDSGGRVSLTGVDMEIMLKGDGEFDKFEYMSINETIFGHLGSKIFVKVK